jgi:hypothetical protein
VPRDRLDQEELLHDRRRVLDRLLDLYNLADSSPRRHGACGPSRRHGR